MKKKNYKEPAITVVEIKQGPQVLFGSNGGESGSPQRAQRFQGAFFTEED